MKNLTHLRHFLPSSTMENVYKRIDEISSYLDPLMPLINSHMVTFITKDSWNKYVPEDIKSEYESHSSTRVFDLFFNEAQQNNDKLRTFLNTASKMRVTKNNDGLFYDVKDFKERLRLLGCGSSVGLNFEKFMCPKKTHEVEAMSDIVAVISKFTGVEHIVDVGDGKGYLSSVLALENKFKVLGIDASQTNTEGAAKRAEKMKKHWKGVRRKMDNADEEKLNTDNVVYQQHTQMVDKDTDLSSIAATYFGQNVGKMGIVGLHTCGSLSSTCLRHFTSNVDLKFIVNVGCCYHLIENGDFPMSRYLRKRGYELTRNTRMLSLQPMDRIVQSERVQSDPLMYRAVFEDMMDNVFNLKGTTKPDVGRISSKCSNFVQYVRKACGKLGLPLNMTDDDIENYYSRMQCHEAKLQFFFLLRVAVAPVIENMILLDRLAFLLESGFTHSHIVRLFDSVVSPRNYGIVSIKIPTTEL